MNVLPRYIVVLMVLAMGTTIHAIDTPNGLVTAISDTEGKFTATGLLSYRDTDEDDNIDTPSFQVGGGDWRFNLQHSVKDWNIGRGASPNGADDFQLRIHGSHLDGPHEDDIDPNRLPVISSKNTDLPFGIPVVRVAGGWATHGTSRANHADHYWVRSAIMASPDPEGGKQHLTAGAFEVRAWHNDKNLNQKPNWKTIASTSAAGSTVTYDAAAKTLSFNIAMIDILDGVGGNSGSIESQYIGDPMESSHWIASDLQLLGQESDGRFRFGQGNVELLDPDNNFNVTGSFSEFLVDDTTGSEISSGTGIFDATSISYLVEERDPVSEQFSHDPGGQDIFAVNLPEEEVSSNGEDYQSQRRFIDDFVNQNIFAVGISDDEAVRNQGLGFTFETEQSLVELTNGFSRSVSDIPATCLLSALVGVPGGSEPPVGSLLGDFNNDGVVDAADYGIWQDNLGLDASALSGNGSGAATVVQADYELWRTHFGESIASGPALHSVPEPATLLLALLALVAVPLRVRCG